MRFVLVLMITASLLAGCEDAQRKPAFSEAETLSQRIANYVIENGTIEETYWHYGHDDVEGDALTYRLRIFDRNRFYYLEFTRLVSETSLRGRFSFERYKMNVNLSELTTGADTIALEAMGGRPGIILEEHFSDTGFDDEVDYCQIFTKKDGPAYRPFTREERDESIENGGPVQSFLFDDGRVMRNAGWEDATPETVQAYYEENLRAIAELLEIEAD